MDQLASAALLIDAQLALGGNLAWAIDSAAHSGSVVSTGTTDVALIDSAMIDGYNAAIQGVLDASYLTATDVFMNEHQTAINNMHLAINDLTSATAVLATVSTVADMATNANTTQEQLQVQAALTKTDMTISQADVDNYNGALGAVETYAQEAGAYLAAANNTNMTSAIDSFAAANNLAVGSYTAVQYTQNIDQMIIVWDATQYMSFSGENINTTLAASDIYAQVGYVGAN